MPYAIKYHPQVTEDFRRLDKGVRNKVFNKIAQLSDAPELGQPLGNKAGMDLSGYRKLYVDNRRIRVVYRVENEMVCILILAVGRREDLEIYRIARQRLDNQ